MKQYQRNLNHEANLEPEPEPNQFINFILEAKSTRELDKGRGARTTSIKPLSTLIPLVMCFNYRNQLQEHEQIRTEREDLKQITNCIIIQNKSLIIIQNQKDIHFEAVKKLKKLSPLTNNNRVYEGDKLLENNHIIKKGVHYIQIRSHLRGGNNNIWIKISSTILTTPINNEQEMFYLYRLIAAWTCMNVNDFTIQRED
jgi:hypothetical protein